MDSEWEQFFSEVNSFIACLQREEGRANYSFCEYAVERLKVCIYSIHNLEQHLLSQLEVPNIVVQYRRNLQELRTCLVVYLC